MTGVQTCALPIFLAQALATETGLNFIAVKGPQLLSRYVGDSERAVRDVFKRARQNAPCIVFFDDIDGLVGRERDSGSEGGASRVLSQLLTEMDGISPLRNVAVVAATNRPDLIVRTFPSTINFFCFRILQTNNNNNNNNKKRSFLRAHARAIS